MSEIKVITGPTVRLVGRQTIDEAALTAFLADEGAETWESDTEVASQKLVEVAGRACYSSYSKPRPGGNAAYLGHILEVGHGSVVEHSVWNFVVTGVSRSLTHEWVRHRAGWAYSQRSQRFCDEASASFVMPPLIERLANEDDWLAARWKRIVGMIQGEYAELSGDIRDALTVESWRAAGGWAIETIPPGDMEWEEIDYALRWIEGRPVGERTTIRKQAREAARSVLPNATETQIFVTANGRALRHFLEARGDEFADAEIRRLAIAFLAILRDEAPNLFGDYRVEERPGVGPVIVTDHRKV